MSSFSLFPKIESEEDRQRRLARLLTKTAQPSVQNAARSAPAAASAVADSSNDLEPASVAYTDTTARAPPTFQRQPSNPDLAFRPRPKSPPVREKAAKPVSPKLRTVASSPGLYAPPSPPPALSTNAEARRPSRRPSTDTSSPAVSSAYSHSPVTASTATSPMSSHKHSSISTTGTTPSPATATSPQFAFSPSLIRANSQSVVYPTVPMAQSPIIKSSPKREAQRRQSTLGPLPPPPPFPPGSSLTRSNTTATHRSASTVRTLQSSVTQSTARTTNTTTTRTTAKPSSAATAQAPRSIFPVFDPSRPLIEQQHSYYPPYNPGARHPRPLTMKSLQEAEHTFAGPPKREGPPSVVSGITSASTARTLVGPPGNYPADSEKKRPQQGPQPQHHLSEKHSMGGITNSTTLVVSPPPRPSTSSGIPGGSTISRAKNGEIPDSVQNGVAVALGACAFVIGVGVEVVGGAVGGLKKGVRKEREKKERRDEKRAEKARRKAGLSPEQDEQGKESESSSRDGAESPGWVVGEYDGEKRVVDFRI